MKDALKRAVDILFHGLPFSYKNNEFKEEILEAAVQKYDADRAEGMTEAAVRPSEHNGQWEENNSLCAGLRAACHLQSDEDGPVSGTALYQYGICGAPWAERYFL